ncbi:ATP-binding protein [Streptomyces sp. NPDC088124]|uniref:ATP-binding protein n=1 Tax=Streptomyces sp. NPDC088124 TaxID=3154654 RepID=UPI0034121EB3
MLVVDNAIDAAAEVHGDPWVEVELRQDASGVEIVVRDSGPGVAPELAREVFTRGFTTKAAQGGERGIGLALTQLVCTRRGGEVAVANTLDGAVFTAHLPAQYAERRNSLDNTVISGQTDVDRLLTRPAAAPAAPAPATPKGMSAETTRLVTTALRTAEGTLLASECAGLIGISRVSARRYLEHLMTTGSVDVSVRYGMAGRPERRYRWRST